MADDTLSLRSGRALHELVIRYTEPTPDQLVGFFKKAKFWPGDAGTKGSFKVAGKGFIEPDDIVNILVAAGRWFRAAALDGPWIFCSDDLPDDFQTIPDDHPRAYLLASVPGTDDSGSSGVHRGYAPGGAWIGAQPGRR